MRTRHYLIINLLSVGLLALVFFMITDPLEAEFDQGRLEVGQLQATAMVALVPKPKLVHSAPPPELEARAFLVGFIDPDGNKDILLEHNATTSLPIASITKLLTALALADLPDLSKPVRIERRAIPDLIDPSALQYGEVFKMRDLLYPLLIESSNDSSVALADAVGAEDFLNLINQTARRIGMSGSNFINPSGLDPATGPHNQASAYDLFRLADYLITKEPELLRITTLQNHFLFDIDGNYHHSLVNTNHLLGHNGWPATIVGGKTGTTPLARRNLLLILRDNSSRGYLVSVVLGTPDHFEETKILIDWVYDNYEF